MTKRIRTQLLAGVALMCSPIAANAGTITFTYTVAGNANPTVNFPIQSYSFVPTALPTTVFGPLDVRYQGDIDLLAGSGPTTTVWDFGASGKFFGSGVEFIGAPVGAIVPFNGTSQITGGTGIFAGATGNTSYVGAFDTINATATFTETINVNTVPEPATASLLGVALAVVVALRQRNSWGSRRARHLARRANV